MAPAQSRRRNSRPAPAVEALETRLTPTVTFATQQTFAVGTDANGAAVGDFNGDGRPDFVVANETDNTVSVLLNTTPAGATTPSFAAQQTFAAGSGAVFVAVADFNGDGRPDLAVANYMANTISVLLNTTVAGATTLTFAAQQTFAAGNGPRDLVVGDFDGDGHPDIAVVNYNSNTVSVLRNTTTVGAAVASFAAQQTFAVGRGPLSLAVGDFNGDGRPDLTAENFNDNTVSVLLNTTANGAAAVSFAAQQTFQVGSGPRFVAAGDFNGDGRPDLAVANSNDNTVSVLLNTTAAGAATASFAAQQTFATGHSPDAVAVSDLDGDGRPDLAVSNFTGNSVSVLVNTTPAGAATPTFAAQQTFALGVDSAGAAAADFNGDGRPDLAVANFASKTVSVLLNTTSPYASDIPVVVGQFGATGVWEYNRTANAWAQLTGANAALLAADALGDVAGDFPGNGVWLYRPAAGWKQINGVDAAALAMNAAGEIVASFPGYGVASYLPAFGWKSLTPSVAYLLAVDGLGDVAGAFHGYGIQLYRPASGWSPINGVDPSLLATDSQGDVFANFHGVGVAAYQAVGGWKVLNGVEATALTADGNGDVFAEFPGYGVGEYLPAAGWHTSTLANAALLGVDALGTAFGAFAGAGVWEYDPAVGWHQVRTSDATLLVVA